MDKDIKFFIDRDIAFLDNNLHISQEGLGQIAKRLLHKYVDAWYFTTVDTFNGIFTLMNIKGVLDKLTYYSPLEDKIKINKFTLYRAINSNNPLFSTMEIPRPRGMIAKYKEVSDTNRKIFDTLSMTTLVDTISDSMEHITGLLEDNKIDETNYSKILAVAVNDLTSNVNRIKTLSSEHDKQFKGSSSKEVTFRLEQEFVDIHGFRSYLDEMITDFKHLIKMSSIKKKIDDQSVKMRKLVDLLETRSDIINRSNLKLMVTYCDYITSCYQLYGGVSLTHMGMETNLCLVVDEIINVNFK